MKRQLCRPCAWFGKKRFVKPRDKQTGVLGCAKALPICAFYYSKAKFKAEHYHFHISSSFALTRPIMQPADTHTIGV